MEAFQHYQVPSKQIPGLTSIQEASEDDEFVHFELCGLPDAVLVQHTGVQMAKGLASFAILAFISLSREQSMVLPFWGI